VRYPAYSKRHSKGRMQATVAVLKQVVASRYGGLRTPSETLSLRWEDIDWEMNRMSIPEPKVEHHEGRGIRSCPIDLPRASTDGNAGL